MNKNISVTVFGPGYGESIVIYIPGMGWGVVDCLLHKRENPVLNYLVSQGVQSLTFVALSHPHEDHYLGLEQIINHYLGRIERICLPHGSSLREYAVYLAKMTTAGRPGYQTFTYLIKKIDEAEKRGARKIRLSENCQIYDKNGIRVIALCPSASSVEDYERILYDAIPKEEGEILSFKSDREHNIISSALLVSKDNTTIVLGGDVETGDTPVTGWRGILRNTDCPDLSCNFIKVSHHGSKNAFHIDAWQKFSEHGKPISVITPYNRLMEPLPAEEQIRKIANFSEEVAVTGRNKFKKPKAIYNRTVVKNLHGVKKWNCIIEADTVGYVNIEFRSDGSVDKFNVREPAHLA